MRSRPWRPGPFLATSIVALATLFGPAVVWATAPSPPGSRATTKVSDFADILVGEVRVVPDPGGRSATLEVGTSIDAACAVVYGPDAAFGWIATDRDMGGGAHRDHRPVLTGLEPGSTVFYRLQGSGPDGTLYASETMTFRTPMAAGAGPVDLARGATIAEVSSEYSSAYAAANAIDGDPTTEWSSAGDGDAAFITLDLGREAAIGAVRFRTRSMSDGSAITDTFTLTVDGRPVGSFPTDAPAEVDVTGRVLRFDVETSSGGNTGALEIEVLEAGGATGR